MAARKSRRPRPKAGSRRIDEKSPPKFDQELLTFLPPPVLDVGEHEYLYHFMLERMQSAVEPKDLIEQIWVRDLVDLTLECFRLRRLRASLLRTNSLKALEKLLETAIEDKEERKDFVDRLSTDDLFVKASTKKILATAVPNSLS